MRLPDGVVAEGKVDPDCTRHADPEALVPALEEAA